MVVVVEVVNYIGLLSQLPITNKRYIKFTRAFFTVSDEGQDYKMKLEYNHF